MAKFKNKTQEKRFNDYVVFFQKIIDLQNQGKLIFYGKDEQLGKITIKAKYGEIHELSPGGSGCAWVGFEHDLDPKTGQYTFVHISQSLPMFIKKWNFRYYENEIKIK